MRYALHSQGLDDQSCGFEYHSCVLDIQSCSFGIYYGVFCSCICSAEANFFCYCIQDGCLLGGWVFDFYPCRLVQTPVFGVINHRRIRSIIHWVLHNHSRFRRLSFYLLHGLHWRHLNRLNHSSCHYPLLRCILPLLVNHHHKPLKCSHLGQ